MRSLHLKLTRRLLLEPPTVSGTTVTLTGQVTLPLTKPVAPVVVEQQLECGKTTIAKTFTPARERTLRHHAHRPRERQSRDLQAHEQGRRQQARRQARLRHLQPPTAGDAGLRRIEMVSRSHV